MFMLAATLVEPHPVMILPFVFMLLAIAAMPFVNPHWWERHYPKVAVALGAVTTTYYVVALGNPGRMLHVGHEYISFIALIGSLFVVAGGIHIDVKLDARPWMNCLFLLTGALLANVIGTTGASMLLIRPWLRMNHSRVSAYHTVFFIFIVSNVGGCLTPIGDPPLFLGYLKGVPFWWVLEKCWIAWGIAVGALIAVFFVFDQRNRLRSPRHVRELAAGERAWKIEGWRNVVFLAMILAAVFIRQPAGLSEAIMIAAAAASWFATPARIHKANDFNFHPIREVAWLFIGIFATMVPALDYLEIHAGQFGLDSDARFFWLTGALSAALDNAPTYLTFLAAALGLHKLSLDQPEHLRQLAATHDHELIAISLASVFFGAMTYIGNGPNFMVKSIAESAKAPTPGFFAYLLKFALPILLPILIIISILFFSPWRQF